MKDKISLSIPKSKKVCGCEIKKMPLGAYLKAAETLKTFPEEFITTCFPGLSLDEILSNLSNCTEDTLKVLINGVFVTAPAFLVSIVSDLTGIEEEKLLNDEQIGADGIVDIIAAFIEVNRLGELTAKIAKLKEGISPAVINQAKNQMNTGSKD